MKISVDDVEVFALNDTQKKVIQNDICCTAFNADMQRRARWIIETKYQECFKRLKAEWDEKFAQPERGITAIPTNADEYAELVFVQPDYKNRTQRDAEAAQAQQAESDQSLG